ncbi:MAG: hypothetical protein IJU19_05855 [Bacteroidales bacterium]|nr:hypothetical protein [Bacteroidales bacterium]
MINITLSTQRQEQIDRYCALSGLSTKAALDRMFDLWERLVFIPETSFYEEEKRRREALRTFKRARERAERGETPDLTMEEIDNEIAIVRAERLAKKQTI